PMVGTFYPAPSPEAPPFVKIGDHVGPETTVCILEAMKVFNEVPAEVSGRIVAVLVERGDPVEFGQPLFRVAVE
ncbi:MAG: biotin/lipoyl-containing protein, partial [Pirellulales bacterium]